MGTYIVVAKLRTIKLCQGNGKREAFIPGPQLLEDALSPKLRLNL